MKRPLLTVLAAAGLVGCGSNDVLQMAAANYAPMPAQSSWTYVTPGGAAGFTTKVLSATQSSGTWIYSVQNYEGLPGTSAIAATGASVVFLGPPAVLDRVLPYVTGNTWSVLTTTAGVTQIRSVDGYDSLVVPAGSFPRCFRLKTEIDTAGNSPTGAFVWVAPNVGDVQYAGEDTAGNVTIQYQLSSYSLGH
jgi:hypothetical protein